MCSCVFALVSMCRRIRLPLHQDLAHNCITTVGDPLLWSALPRLSIVYLHGNAIESAAALSGLAALPALALLTVKGNPLYDRRPELAVRREVALLVRVALPVSGGGLVRPLHRL